MLSMSRAAREDGNKDAVGWTIQEDYEYSLLIKSPASVSHQALL